MSPSCSHESISSVIAEAGLGRQRFVQRCDASPIVFSDPARIPPDSANDYVPSTNPGGRLPHVWLGPDASSYDGLNFEWTVLAGSPQARERAAARAEDGRRTGLEVGLVALEARNWADPGWSKIQQPRPHVDLRHVGVAPREPVGGGANRVVQHYNR